MKKLILGLLTLAVASSASFAQDAELKSAQANIQNKKYIAALEDLNKSKKAVTKLIADELSSVLPAKFGEFEIGDQQDGGMQMEGVNVNKTYTKPAPETAGTNEGESTDGDAGMEEGMYDPSMMDPGMGGMSQENITVSITTNMMMASEVMNAHSMSENDMGGSGESVAVRIKGYRAILKTYGGENGQESSEVAAVIVGGAYIQVEARGLAEKGQAEKFINLIDFDKLKGIVGE